MILELPALAAQPLAEYFQKHGTLRGADFQAARAGARRNGRVFLRLADRPPEPLEKPAAPDLVTTLARIWDLPAPAIEPDRKQWNHPTNRVNSDTTDKQKRRPVTTGHNGEHP
jgi:hypothetical protein